MSRGGVVYNVSLADPAAPIGKYILLRGVESQAPQLLRRHRAAEHSVAANQKSLPRAEDDVTGG
jgi:hypothetical protein